MTSVMREQHAEAVLLGGPAACPFDCGACEAAMSRHVHPSACGHPVECFSPECYEDVSPSGNAAPVVACAACSPADVPDVPCSAHVEAWAPF